MESSFLKAPSDQMQSLRDKRMKFVNDRTVIEVRTKRIQLQLSFVDTLTAIMIPMYAPSSSEVRV